MVIGQAPMSKVSGWFLEEPMHSNVTGLLDDLAILRKLANSVDERLIRVFPLDSFDNKRLFKITQKSVLRCTL